MELYRITKSKYADKLFGPGIEGRWNIEGDTVVYASDTRSLACLENIVHKNGRGKVEDYRTMVIYAPDDLGIMQINLNDLPSDWNQKSLCANCQMIGSVWYGSGKYPILKVPSAVIPDEFNYVLNAKHPEFSQFKLIDIRPFYFDKRIGGE